MKNAFRLLSVLAALLFFLPSTHAATFTVSNTNDAGAESLRAAILTGNGNGEADIINFVAGSDGEITLASDFPLLSGGYTFNGRGSGQTVISGANAFRVFRTEQFQNPMLELNDLAIVRANNGDFTSPALHVVDGTVVVNRCRFTSNSSRQFGGGAYLNFGSTGTFNDCSFERNNAGGGGFGSEGGGLATNNNVTLRVNRCTFFANTADTNGGALAVFADQGSTIIADSTFASNTSGFSGGVALDGGDATRVQVLRCTFVSNAATNSNPNVVGGMRITNGSAFISGNILAANSANANAAPNVRQLSNGAPTPLTLNGYNLIGSNRNSNLTASPGDLIGTDAAPVVPQLGGLQNNGGYTSTRAPQTGSPAIDAGDPNAAPTGTDQRGNGFARVRNGRIDIGAVEFSNVPNNPPTQPTLSVPATIAQNGVLSVSATSSDADGQLITYNFLVKRGAATLFNLSSTSGTASFNLSSTSAEVPGDVLTVEATASDGPTTSARTTASVTVAETPSLVVTTLSDSSTNVDGETSLREAINFANTNNNDATTDVITFVDEVRGTIELSGPNAGGFSAFELLAPVEIRGPGANVLNVRRVSGGDYRIFDVINVTATLSGLTISDGNLSVANLSGGGIRNVGDLTLVACTVRDNVAGFGGGIANFGTRLSVQNCTISDNTANNGNSGGGIDSTRTLVVSNSTISGNRAPSGNNSGGGLRIGNPSNATLTNCTLTNCTLTNNLAAGVNSASGVYVASGTMTFANTIVAGNQNSATRPDVVRLASGGGTVTSNGFNLVGTTQGATFDQSGDQSGISSAQLALGELAPNNGPTSTHALLTGSVAIDAGSNALIPAGVTTDQRGAGFPRIVGATVDVGAFELDAAQSGPSFVVTKVADTDDGVCGVNDCSLREAVDAANDEGAGMNTITFDETVFDEIQTITLSLGEISITASVEIQGPGARLLSISGGTRRIFNIGADESQTWQTGPAGSLTTLSGMSLVNGMGSVTGGEGDGGAIISNETLVLNNCTLSGSEAGRGAAIFNNATLTLNNCTLSDNEAGSDGGAIYNFGTLTLNNCTLSGNRTIAGGGIHSNGTLTLNSCTLSGNNARSGGGLFINSGTLSLNNSIVAGNTANTNPDLSGTINSGDFNLLGNAQGVIFTGSPANNKVGVGAMLGALGPNGGPTDTFALAITSPAVNAGNTALELDQRGVARPQAGRDDIGAFELDASNFSPSFVVTTFVDEDNGTSDARVGNGTSLREAILLANTDSAEDTISFDAEVFASRQTITLGSGSPLPTVAGALIITGPNAGVEVTGRVGPANALFSVGSGASVSSTKLFFRGSKTGVRNGGTFNLTDGGFSSSTTNLENNGTATLVRCAVGGSSNGLSNNGTLTVDASRFEGNTNALVNASAGTATVRTSTFSDNSAGATNNGTLTLSNSTLNQNGDAVRNQGGSAIVIQSTLVGNSNGVINSGGANLRLLRATVAGNGDGLRLSGNGAVELRTSLLVGNGTNLIGTPSSGGSNLVNVTAQVAGLEVDGNGFPLLKNNGGPTATVALLSGSRAIDRGEVGIQSGNDQRGPNFPRVMNGRADIGAFEFQTPPTPQNLREAAPSGGTS